MTAIEAAQGDQKLSRREIEVLNALSKGLNNREIGEQLSLSPKTIDSHRTNLLKKMHVNSTAALLVKAIKSGILRHD